MTVTVVFLLLQYFLCRPKCTEMLLCKLRSWIWFCLGHCCDTWGLFIKIFMNFWEQVQVMKMHAIGLCQCLWVSLLLGSEAIIVLKRMIFLFIAPCNWSGDTTNRKSAILQESSWGTFPSRSSEWLPCGHAGEGLMQLENSVLLFMQ